MNISRNKHITANSDIFAAEEEWMEEEDVSLNNQLDDMADNIEDIQDSVNEIDEDAPDIEIDNNIDNHYIAECAQCKGIFISAVLQSDQELDHITGICPLCGNDSDQYLNWVVKAVND